MERWGPAWGGDQGLFPTSGPHLLPRPGLPPLQRPSPAQALRAPAPRAAADEPGSEPDSRSPPRQPTAPADRRSPVVSRAPLPSDAHGREAGPSTRGASWHPVKLAAGHAARAASQPAPPPGHPARPLAFMLRARSEAGSRHHVACRGARPQHADAGRRAGEPPRKGIPGRGSRTEGRGGQLGGAPGRTHTLPAGGARQVGGRAPHSSPALCPGAWVGSRGRIALPRVLGPSVLGPPTPQHVCSPSLGCGTASQEARWCTRWPGIEPSSCSGCVSGTQDGAQAVMPPPTPASHAARWTPWGAG